MASRNKAAGYIAPEGDGWVLIPHPDQAVETRGKYPRSVGLARVPARLPYGTYPEMREFSKAMRDGGLRRNWVGIEGEAALAWSSPDALLEARFDGGGLLAWWNFSLTHDALRDVLQRLGPDAVLLAHICLGMVMENPNVTTTLDDLIQALGWDPRSPEARREMRRDVWLWLTIIESIPVIGRRPGTFRDALTKEELDLTSRDPFLRIMGTRGYTRRDFADEGSPIEVSFGPGKWIESFMGNAQVLQHLGDVSIITGIPAKRASGKYARSYAQALFQQWREDAMRAQVSHSGDEHKTRVVMPTITRECLHSLCPREPYVHHLLNSKDPARAARYDAEAWRLLRQHGVFANRPTDFAFRVPEGRYKWSEDFLKQSLAVKPSDSIAAQIAEIRNARKGGGRKNAASHPNRGSA